MLVKKNYEIMDDDVSVPFSERLKKQRESITESPEHDPFLINDMKKGVDRIIRALENNEKIVICGDYDTDGVTSTTIMMRGLRNLGADVSYRIPDRLKEGYGLNMNMVNEINRSDASLVITVDNGIRSADEISKLDADVIVTDHHECPDVLPDSVAVMDCRRKDNTYPFDTVCGAVMAYKLMEAVYSTLGKSGQERSLIPYAAIGTIGDVMPMKDENRTIVKEGLKMLENGSDEGLRALVKHVNGELNAEAIGFYISPMINAASRVGNINEAMNLMLCDDEKEAEDVAQILQMYNEARKAMSSNIFVEEIEQVMKNYDFSSEDPIIVKGDWHKGVIGVTASKLVEMFNRPAIVISTEGNTGSCRSFGGINMMEMLDSAKDSLIRYGGHPGAAGITVGDIELFRKRCHEFMKDRSLVYPSEKIDMRILPEDISLSSVREINKYEPFSGTDSPAPRFVSKLYVESVRRVGKPDPMKGKAGGEHLRARFYDDDGNTYDGIGFFKGDMADMLKDNQKVDVVFEMNENHYTSRSGKEYVTAQMMIDDIVFESEYSKKFTLPDSRDFQIFYDMVSNMINRDSEGTIFVSDDYLQEMMNTQEYNNGRMNNPDIRCLVRALDECNVLNFCDAGREYAIRKGKGQSKIISQTKAFFDEAKRLKKQEKNLE